MAGRPEALHAKKLEQALKSHERFPINLEWMVDVFKYKHISSLTTHLKRHFKMNVHYKRFSQEQNKRVWTYFISVECFIGICEYVRHAARKKIANVWLRKVGIKGTARKATQDYEEDDEGSFSDEDFVGEDDEEADAEERDYTYYQGESPTKRRRLDDEDEEFHCDEDDLEDEEERTYFEEMEEEEEACAGYETEDSVDYESSEDSRNSSLAISSDSVHYRPNEIGNANLRSSLSSSEELRNSSDSNVSDDSAPSSPTCANSERGFAIINSNYLPTLGNAVNPTRMTQSAVVIKPQVPDCEVLPANALEMCKEQVDWSYLHLRPNPYPLGGLYDYPAKYFASLMFGPQQFYPQMQPCTYVVGPGGYYQVPAFMDPNGYGMRVHNIDNLHCDMTDERQFDTNMFLSIPSDENHYPFP